MRGNTERIPGYQKGNDEVAVGGKRERKVVRSRWGGGSRVQRRKVEKKERGNGVNVDVRPD